MQLNIIDLFTIFAIIFCMIGGTSSANFFDMSEKSLLAEYTRLRDASVHRGVLFSLSPQQKEEMCEDLYSAQLYVNAFTEEQKADKSKTIRLTSDSFSERTLDVDLDYKLYPREVVDDLQSGSSKEKGFVMRCFGRHFAKRTPVKTQWYHVVSAFQPKWLLFGHRKTKNVRDMRLPLLGFLTLSPDRVLIEQAELETHYINMGRTMKALGEESPEYVDQIEKRNALSTLSKELKYTLCASILSSSVYRDERLEFSMKWMYDDTDNLENVSKEISFKSPIYAEETLKADCILCKAFRLGGRRTADPQNLYLTSSFDNEHSLIVVKEEGDHYYVDKHFKNIPILITLGKEMNRGGLILNYTADREVEN